MKKKKIGSVFFLVEGRKTKCIHTYLLKDFFNCYFFLYTENICSLQVRLSTFSDNMTKDSEICLKIQKYLYFLTFFVNECMCAYIKRINDTKFKYIDIKKKKIDKITVLLSNSYQQIF